MEKILITGGTGTLGNAIVKTAVAEERDWEITIFSRDYIKQAAMKRKYPQLHYVIGDICDYDSIYQTAVGQDVIIHAAAQKHIPAAEENILDAIRVNVHGSQNVAMAAVMAGVRQVVGISTDKVCTPTSIYGMTKAMMERMYVQYAADYWGTVDFTLCRYGNVLGSNGSVLQVWERQAATGGPITLTDPTMTRFWLSEADAVSLVFSAMMLKSGQIIIPKAPALSMAKLANYLYPDMEKQVIGRRPGEKDNELLVDADEVPRLIDGEDFWVLLPYEVGRQNLEDIGLLAHGYTSADPVEELSPDQLRAMIGGE